MQHVLPILPAHMDLPATVLLLSAAIFMKSVYLEELEMCIFSVLDGVSES
jgi:hypothetical protein